MNENVIFKVTSIIFKIDSKRITKAAASTVSKRISSSTVLIVDSG